MRLISGVNVDGGTRVRSRVPLAMSPELEGQLLQICAPRSREQEAQIAREGGHLLRLRLLDGTTIEGQARCMGIRRSRVSALFPDLLYVEIDLEAQEATVQAKARALWSEGAGARGWRVWCDRYLRALDRACFTTSTEGDALRERWRVTGVELCADAVGVSFSRADAGSFVGAHAGSSVASTERRDTVETIAVGTRASPLSVCLYDKDAEIKAARKADVYAQVHQAHGWDGEARRTRCEVRFSGIGLQWEDPETGELIDLRDPIDLGQQRTLDVAWKLATFKRRMVIDDGATRRRRCPTDPRWQLYQRAADVPEQPWSYRQRVAVADETWTVRRQRAAERALRGAAAVAVLDGLGHEARAVVRLLDAAKADGADADELHEIAAPVEGMAIAALRRLFADGARVELARWAAAYDRTQALTRERIEQERAAFAAFASDLAATTLAAARPQGLPQRPADLDHLLQPPAQPAELWPAQVTECAGSDRAADPAAKQ
jgi:hypothetical protein